MGNGENAGIASSFIDLQAAFAAVLDVPRIQPLQIIETQSLQWTVREKNGTMVRQNCEIGRPSQ